MSIIHIKIKKHSETESDLEKVDISTDSAHFYNNGYIHSTYLQKEQYFGISKTDFNTYFTDDKTSAQFQEHEHLSCRNLQSMWYILRYSNTPCPEYLLF